MFDYIVRRTLQIIPLIVIISVLSFAIIELPPGDYVTMRIVELEQTGTRVDEDEIARLTEQYGLDKTLVERYALWAWNIISRGHLGRSYQWEQPVTQVIGERIALTMSISLLTLIFIWIVAIPIGIYAATHQYSLGDYVFTFFGFIDISVPGFLLALVVMYLAFTQLDISVTGLFSPEFADAPWSFARLLDELRKQYVVTARAKGVAERTLLFKYPVRIAINPLISTIGWLLPFWSNRVPAVPDELSSSFEPTVHLVTNQKRQEDLDSRIAMWPLKSRSLPPPGTNSTLRAARTSCTPSSKGTSVSSAISTTSALPRNTKGSVYDE